MVKEINLKDLFPDCESIGAANVSDMTYVLRYGRNGEGLELSLFHSEDKDDAEYHLNLFKIDRQDNVLDMMSYNATILKPNITQFSIDVVDNDVDAEKIKKILSENGIEVRGISNDCGWKYDEYMNK